MGLRIGIGTKLAIGDSSSEEADKGFTIGEAIGFATGFATDIGFATGIGFATDIGAATGIATGDVSSSLSFANGSLNSLLAAAILCRIS